MITVTDHCHVLTAVIPFYVAMILAYGSVKWWKIFSPDQCSEINRFVALFAVPLLSFHFISTNNPFAMNYRLIVADTLQKIIVLAIWSRTSSRGSLEWSITLFSLSTLSNTLVMGIPVLLGMYRKLLGKSNGPNSCASVHNLVHFDAFLVRVQRSKNAIAEQFPDTAGSTVSFKVDSDIISLDGKGLLQIEAEVGEDGKLRVTEKINEFKV